MKRASFPQIWNEALVLAQASQLDGRRAVWLTPDSEHIAVFLLLGSLEVASDSGLNTELSAIGTCGQRQLSAALNLKCSHFHEQRGVLSDMVALGQLRLSWAPPVCLGVDTVVVVAVAVMVGCSVGFPHAEGFHYLFPAQGDQCDTKHCVMCCLTKWLSDTQLGFASTMLFISL